MASFTCHVFGGTKRVRLERIVRPAATNHKALRLQVAAGLMVLLGRQWTTTPIRRATPVAQRRTRRKDCPVRLAIGSLTRRALLDQWVECLRLQSRCWRTRMNN